MMSSPNERPYTLLREIGVGNFSKVHLAKDHSGAYVAIKCVQKHKEIAFKEAKLLKSFDHPNIIRMIEYKSFADQIQIALEYCPQNTLELYESYPQGLIENQVKCIIFQVAYGLAHIHTRGIIHRDIKPENILIDRETAFVKIIDFGLAVTTEKAGTDYIATRWYRAPQNLLATKQYSTAIDVFSLGCLAVQLILGTPLFPGADNLDQIVKIIQLLGPPTQTSWPKGYAKLASMNLTLNKIPDRSLKDLSQVCSSGLIQLLECMVALNPSERITCQGIIRHPYFQNIKAILPPVVHSHFQQYLMSGFSKKGLEQSSQVTTAPSSQHQRLNDLPTTQQTPPTSTIRGVPTITSPKGIEPPSPRQQRTKIGLKQHQMPSGLQTSKDSSIQSAKNPMGMKIYDSMRPDAIRSQHSSRGKLSTKNTINSSINQVPSLRRQAQERSTVGRTTDVTQSSALLGNTHDQRNLTDRMQNQVPMTSPKGMVVQPLAFQSQNSAAYRRVSEREPINLQDVRFSTEITQQIRTRYSEKPPNVPDNDNIPLMTLKPSASPLLSPRQTEKSKVYSTGGMQLSKQVSEGYISGTLNFQKPNNNYMKNSSRTDQNDSNKQKPSGSTVVTQARIGPAPLVKEQTLSTRTLKPGLQIGIGSSQTAIPKAMVQSAQVTPKGSHMPPSLVRQAKPAVINTKNDSFPSTEGNYNERPLDGTRPSEGMKFGIQTPMLSKASSPKNSLKTIGVVSPQPLKPAAGLQFAPSTGRYTVIKPSDMMNGRRISADVSGTQQTTIGRS